MNQFNRTPINPTYLPGAKPKPGRNDALALVRATIRTQRNRWSNQIGQPPIPNGRSGLGIEFWELNLFQTQQDTLALGDLAKWTGRTSKEILEIIQNLDPVGEEDDLDDFDPMDTLDNLSDLPKKKQIIRP